MQVDNTDAEGRLVLSDALHYTQITYKPNAVVDLATLTGALIIIIFIRIKIKIIIIINPICEVPRQATEAPFCHFYYSYFIIIFFYCYY